jgi:hypothetical protein
MWPVRRAIVWSLTSAVLVLTLVATACGGDDDDSESDPGTTDTSDATDTGAEPTVVTGAGNITANVDEYRALLGPDNGGAPATHDTGRREINWDQVPDELAAPNPLPGDFFNGAGDPTARGAALETPGTHVAVSADGDNPSGVPVRFGDINPSYTDAFRAFSEERLFSPVGSNVVDLRFFVPGTDTPAAVRGFGAVYTDVDREEAATFELFDADEGPLGTFSVPVSEDGLSFLGIAYPDAVVGRVRITYGDTELGPDDGDRYDVAVMDDFIYGEPQPATG